MTGLSAQRLCPELIETLKDRAKILMQIRRFFAASDFVEVNTPCLVRHPDPALYLDSFSTQLDMLDSDPTALYLHTSPEAHMKRLVAAGMERVYQIVPFFRNGEITPVHNPEFLGLEWYRVGDDIEKCMQLTEEMIAQVAKQALGKDTIVRDGHEVSLCQPYPRVTMRHALQQWGGIDVPLDWEPLATRASLETARLFIAEDDSFDDMINRAMIERVEPKMAESGPVFITEYPAPMAALARLKPWQPWVAERFELFAGGLELCNGYGELTDAGEQRRRFASQLEERARMGKSVPQLDEDFLQALEQGLPACAGCALGLDRLVMLLCGKSRIDEVQAFPMKKEG